MQFAFLDFDGTLYKGHLWKDLAEHYRETGRRRALTWAYLLGHMALWPLNLLGLMSHEAFYASWQRDLSWLLRGLSREEATALFQHILHTRVLADLRAETLERLRWHQAQGHATMLVSGCFAELLQMLAAEVGVPYVAGTEPEVKDGRYTGRATGVAMTGKGKVEAVRRFAQEQGLDIDWAASFAYGDSRTDIPLLEAVGHPVAVYPDEVLDRHARAQGWEVIGERSR